MPIVYMAYLDGRGYDLDGVTGSFLADAGISIAVCLFLSWALPRWRRGSGIQPTGRGAGQERGLKRRSR